MHLLTTIVFIFLCGNVCSRLAKYKQRNPKHWFWMGILFGFLAVIVLACLPRSKKIIPASAPPALPKIPALKAIDVLHSNRIWYYLDKEKQQFGPMSLDLLSLNWREGKVQETTYVWNETFDQWKALKEVLQPDA